MDIALLKIKKMTFEMTFLSLFESFSIFRDTKSGFKVSALIFFIQNSVMPVTPSKTQNPNAKTSRPPFIFSIGDILEKARKFVEANLQPLHFRKIHFLIILIGIDEELGGLIHFLADVSDELLLLSGKLPGGRRLRQGREEGEKQGGDPPGFYHRALILKPANTRHAASPRGRGQAGRSVFRCPLLGRAVHRAGARSRPFLWRLPVDKIIYTLDTPVQFTPSRLVEELSFKTDMSVRDLRRLEGQQGSVGAGATLLSLLSGEPVELIDALSAHDFFKAQEMIRPFLKTILGTGAN